MFRILIILTLIHLDASFSYSQKIESWTVDQLKNQIIQSKENVVVINFWATYCKPCIEEIPGLINVVRTHKDSVILIMVSVDGNSVYPKKLTSFIKKHHYEAIFAWLNEKDANYFCPKIDSGWGGSIPATIIINQKKGLRKLIESPMSEVEFKEQLEIVLGD